MTNPPPDRTNGPEPFADRPLADFMRGLAELPPMTASGDAAEMRRTTADRSAHRPAGPDMETRDLRIDGRLPARLYRPGDHLEALVVYFHGGGWTIGNLDTHDRACRLVAKRAGVPVLAVDYRLAPEHPAPAGTDDAVAALEWVARAPDELGMRPKTITLAGDSSGGTLAALAALRTRGRALAPDLVALAYPTTALDAEGGSMITNAHGYGLDAADIEWFGSQWVPDRERWSDPDVSPLRVEDLSAFPATIIVTCELDPLRDQGEAFAQRLLEAGVDVSLRREPGMVHNFLLWDLVSPSCAEAIDRFAEDIRAGVDRAASSLVAEREGFEPSREL